MFIIFGSKENKNDLGEVRRYCSVCGRDTQHTREERTTQITLYFIPVLPMKSKHVDRCNFCGHERES